MDKHSKCTIHWVDISAPGQYWAGEEEAAIVKVVSSGYFIHKSEIEITIAQTISQEIDRPDGHTYGGLLSIPHGVVEKIEVG